MSFVTLGKSLRQKFSKVLKHFSPILGLISGSSQWDLGFHFLFKYLNLIVIHTNLKVSL